MKYSAQQNQQMLKSMLPESMIDKFKNTGVKSKDSAVVVDTYAEVSVIFIIIDQFVNCTKALKAENLVRLLNIIYTQFDEITTQCQVYKIETVCEVYMCCVGCPDRAIDHADRAATCALVMMSNMDRVREMLVEQLTEDEGQLDCCKNLNIKIGINSGKIVAGVLNTPATIRFKLFGDTVNTASRMQSLSDPGKIQISEKTFKKLVGGSKSRSYVFSPPRQVQAKGKGVMNTWFVERMRSEKEIAELESLSDRKEEVFVDAEGNVIAGMTGTVAGKIRSKLGSLREEDSSGTDRFAEQQRRGSVGEIEFNIPEDAGRSQFLSDSAESSLDFLIRKYDAPNDDTLTDSLSEDSVMKRAQLDHVFKKLRDRKQPELSVGQFLLTLLGTNIKAIGRCEEAAYQESSFFVHRWPMHLRVVRLFQCFFGLNFCGQGLYRISTTLTVEETDACAAEVLEWEKTAQKAAFNLHVVNNLVFGLPLCASLLFLTYRRQFFWRYHQSVMCALLLLIGICVAVQSVLWVELAGFGTVTMYVMTVYQYQLVHFSFRMLLAVGVPLVFFMMTLLFTVDAGTESYMVDGDIFRVPLNHDKNLFVSISELLKPTYETTSFDSMSWDDECVDYIKESASQQCPASMNLTECADYAASEMSLENVVDKFIVNSGIIAVTGNIISYWQIIPSERATTYFCWLLIYTLMLLPPSLMGDYHERVCYNKETKQEEKKQKMDKQGKFEERLLKRLLPPEIVSELAAKRARNEMVAEQFDEVTILFCDMVGFTKFSSELDPSELMIFLSALYAKYSAVITGNSLYTVEVIGDALLAVAGCPSRIKTKDHACRALKAGFELLETTKKFSEEVHMPINIRVGIHSGKVIAGVVGMKDPRYHLFGEAVKVAELMESSGKPDHVHCSHRTWEFVSRAEDEMSINFRNFVKFAKRGDLDEKSQKKLTGLDYGSASYFVSGVGDEGNLTPAQGIQFRRLTLGRNNISREDVQRRISGGNAHTAPLQRGNSGGEGGGGGGGSDRSMTSQPSIRHDLPLMKGLEEEGAAGDP